MRGWGPIRKLLVERASEREGERELKWLHNAAGGKKKKNSHSLLLFLPESLQNLINSKPRLLFFTSEYLSCARAVSPFEVICKPGPGALMSSGRQRWAEMFQMENSRQALLGYESRSQDTVSLNSSQFHFWPDHRHSHSCGCSIKVSLPDYSL